MFRSIKHSIKHKVVAIPLAVTRAGSMVARQVADEEGALVLGAPTAAQVKGLGVGLDPRRVYALSVDLDRPKSVDDFFKIAIGQFGQLDVIVVETIRTPMRHAASPKAIGLAARRLLHCLDAALKYTACDLHIINVAPGAERYAIPIATAFLGARLATQKSKSAPRVRMSAISPFEDDAADHGSLTRTILHIMREPRTPDTTEIVFQHRSESQAHYPKLAQARSKIMVPM